MSDFLFKDRDGQTPLPPELQKGLRIKTIQTVGELDEYEEDNIANRNRGQRPIMFMGKVSCGIR